MDNKDAEIAELKDRIRTLEVQIDAVTRLFDQKINKSIRMHNLLKGESDERTSFLCTELGHITERIVCLERRSYPNLAHDLNAVHKIIGEAKWKLNDPLDRRKR